MIHQKPKTAIEAMTIQRRGFQAFERQPEWVFRLARVVDRANRKPGDKTGFYQLKDVILKAFGNPDGFDRQLIEHGCWGESYMGCGPQCMKCCGTGVYQRTCVRLDRFRLGEFVFHQPNGTLPVVAKGLCEIVGYVGHTESRIGSVAYGSLQLIFGNGVNLTASPSKLPKLRRMLKRALQIAEWIDVPESEAERVHELANAEVPFQ